MSDEHFYRAIATNPEGLLRLVRWLVARARAADPIPQRWAP